MKEETRELPHSLTLENRTLLKAGGVLRIDSFDEETIAAATGGGTAFDPRGKTCTLRRSMWTPAR